MPNANKKHTTNATTITHVNWAVQSACQYAIITEVGLVWGEFLNSLN
jgi:hypothetical protein